MIAPALIAILRQHFPLDWYGVHGVRHWSRVRVNGLRLAAHTGANINVVEHFAFLHDSCRQADDADEDHGARAAQFLYTLPRHALPLTIHETALLTAAIAGHTHGRTPPNITVATCWDADRLDIGRISVRPDPQYLNTDAARCPIFIEESWQRSRTRHQTNVHEKHESTRKKAEPAKHAGLLVPNVELRGDEAGRPKASLSNAGFGVSADLEKGD